MSDLHFFLIMQFARYDENVQQQRFLQLGIYKL